VVLLLGERSYFLERLADELRKKGARVVTDAVALAVEEIYAVVRIDPKPSGEADGAFGRVVEVFIGEDVYESGAAKQFVIPHVFGDFAVEYQLSNKNEHYPVHAHDAASVVSREVFTFPSPEPFLVGQAKKPSPDGYAHYKGRRYRLYPLPNNQFEKLKQFESIANFSPKKISPAVTHQAQVSARKRVSFVDVGAVAKALALSLIIALAPTLLLALSIFSFNKGNKAFLASNFGTAEKLLFFSGRGFGLIDKVSWVFRAGAASQLSLAAKDMSRLAGVFKSVSGGSWAFSSLPEDISALAFSSPENFLSGYKDFLSLTPELLGLNGRRSWALAFQDPSVARPSGGVIREVVLLEVEGAEILSSEVFSAKAIDENLTGIVSPPGPIEEYLGAETWSVRDAGWEADFRKSAERISWFIDKSLGKRVDGVVLINESFRVSFEGDNELGLFEAIEKLQTGLETADIQMVLADPRAKQILAKRKWDGNLDGKGPWVGFVKTDFSGSARERVKIDKDKKGAELLITNSGQEDYRGYIKLLLPPEARLGKVSLREGNKVTEKENTLVKNDNHMEYSLFIEVPEEESVALSFSWAEPEGELALIRQPGAEHEVLTGTDVLSYNTPLPRIIYIK